MVADFAPTQARKNEEKGRSKGKAPPPPPPPPAPVTSQPAAEPEKTASPDELSTVSDPPSSQPKADDTVQQLSACVPIVETVDEPKLKSTATPPNTPVGSIPTPLTSANINIKNPSPDLSTSRVRILTDDHGPSEDADNDDDTDAGLLSRTAGQVTVVTTHPPVLHPPRIASPPQVVILANATNKTRYDGPEVEPDSLEVAGLLGQRLDESEVIVLGSSFIGPPEEGSFKFFFT